MPEAIRLVLAAALVACAQPASAFINFALLQNATQPDTSCQIHDMTPDGYYKAGACQPTAAQGEQPTRWVGLGLEILGLPAPEFNGGIAYGISDTGKVVGLTGDPLPLSPRGFVWTLGTWSLLPNLGTCPVWPLDVSGDGNRTVGTIAPNPCTPVGLGAWIRDSGGGYVLPGVSQTIAQGISNDGQTVVGTPAFRWDAGVLTPLTLPVPGENATATGVSPDGSIVIGFYDSDPTSGTDYRQALWGPSGFMELGALGTFAEDAHATTPPGASDLPLAVVGGDSDATIWTEPFGLEPLEDRLFAIGLFHGSFSYDLLSATGMTDDARIIVGTLWVPNGSGHTSGYIAVIPQFHAIQAAYAGSIDMGGYVQLDLPNPSPPERLAANVQFFGTSGGTFASGTTAAPTFNPAPLYAELGLGTGSLVFGTEPLTVWTFEYDGGLDAPLQFTTEYPADTLVPEAELTLLRYVPAIEDWVDLRRLALDTGSREITVEVPAGAFGPDQRVHMAFGKTLAACSDDLDNDGDGRIDWNGVEGGPPPDPHCQSPVDFSERNPNACGLGAELVIALSPLLGLRARRRRRQRTIALLRREV